MQHRPDRADHESPSFRAGRCQYSIGAEPTVTFTWATADTRAPFLTVTDVAWVSARVGNDGNDLDYQEWVDVTAQLDRADEADEQADGIYRGIDSLADNDRARANLDIDRLRRLAAGIREEAGQPRYYTEFLSQWISHDDPNDPSGTEIESMVERGEGADDPNVGHATREAAEAACRKELAALNPDDYSPENWYVFDQ